MTAAYLDTQPALLEKWASLNPQGRIGRPDELRGVVAWLASDASTFCTGSELRTVSPLCFATVKLTGVFAASSSAAGTIRGDDKLRRTLSATVMEN